MKNIIFFLVFGSAFTVRAQYGYGNGQRQQQRQTVQAPQEAPKPNFDVRKHVGIIVYETEKAAKKSGIKLKSKQGAKFYKIVTDYNKSIKDITRINSFLLKSTKDMVEGFQKKALKSGDFSEQLKVIKKMNEDLKPISETLKVEKEKLYTSMKGLLSEKLYKKWIKYNKKRQNFFTTKE